MYTEFYFRANINDGPVADWLDNQINGGGWFEEPFQDSHEFFTLPRWHAVFIGGGAVYQESRKPIYRPKAERGEPYDNQLVLASSLKDYGGEIASFVNWIEPYLEQADGDFLGYSLYEDSRPIGWDAEGERDRDFPILYFKGLEPAYADLKV